MVKLSFNESLLHLHGTSPEAACVLIAMYQNADPTGAVGANGDELRAHYNRTFGKRITTATFTAARDELVKKRLLPSLTAVHPPGKGEVDAEQAERLKTALDRLEADMTRVRPKDKDDHERLFALLRAYEILEVAARGKRETLATADGSPIVAGGRRYHYQNFEWDYGFVQAWIKKYTLPHLLATLSNLYATGVLQKVPHDGSFRDKRAKLVAYLTGAFEGRAATPQDRFANVRPDLTSLG